MKIQAFDYGNANDSQIKAISTTEGPVLIIAGPGTGKTFTLVQRAIYLIEEKKIKPEQILMATFTEKAAKEIVTRITNELSSRGILVNINEMYIGTFHSICLRLIKENLELTNLKKNFRLLDEFDQKYAVFQNIFKFRNIENIELLQSKISSWALAEKICNYVNVLSEELVSVDALKNDPDQRVQVLGAILEKYHLLLQEENLLDFSTIQTEAYFLLKNNPELLANIQSKISYFMIDEYQDTNYIQEQLVFLLGNKTLNICVVGDDDQGLYRFRGATIRNILEFPSKFKNGECEIVKLDINYRSNSNIVDFYNDWIETTYGERFSFEWNGFRHEKQIVSHKKSSIKSPAVVKLIKEGDVENWYNSVLTFITQLGESGKLTDYNQIAFLFYSVKNKDAIGLARFLEENGISVYSPRSNMFFERDEIVLLIGLLMIMFPKYFQALERDEYTYLSHENKEYYFRCVQIANNHLLKPELLNFRKFIVNKGRTHATLEKNTDYSYSGLIYELFAFSPFNEILKSELGLGLFDTRPARNLALFTQIISRFEYLHRVDILEPNKIDKTTENLFNLYLKLLMDEGLFEYEDDSEYAPSGCVSFLTIHQSKGMEFPIVITDSLYSLPKNTTDEILLDIESRHYKRPAFEPIENIKYFDFWRLYYTAFSRAQDLLVLTSKKNNRTPSLYFREILKTITPLDSEMFDLREFSFHEVKDVNLKQSFSFTSHISVYEECSLQYKFYKELGFTPVRVSAILFGMLVHQTIEDVHKAALKKEVHLITEKNIEDWFNTNYITLSKRYRFYIAGPQKNIALDQVLRYAKAQANNWHILKDAEVDVSLVKEDYIIKGTIDVIKGEGDTVELIDFKAERKPDIFSESERVEHYRRQLQLYAHLIEAREGHKVSKMHLYYTGEENSSPYITFNYQKTAIEGTILAFDSVVQKILKKEFETRSQSLKTCNECDFRHYCNK